MTDRVLRNHTLSFVPVTLLTLCFSFVLASRSAKTFAMQHFRASGILTPSGRTEQPVMIGNPRSAGSTIEDAGYMSIIVTHKAHDTPLSEEEFSLWLAVAEPGSIIQYHVGFLSLDVAETNNNLSSAAHRKLMAVANLAWCAGEARIVHLVQRRLGPDRFEYLAVMRPRRTGASQPQSKAQRFRGKSLASAAD
jgi:hypothetical protein